MRAALTVFLLCGGAVCAEPSAQSPRPLPNPRAAQVVEIAVEPSAAILRPLPKPAFLNAETPPERGPENVGAAAPDPAVAAASLAAPTPEKKGLFAALKRKKQQPDEAPETAPEIAQNGFLCGVRGIEGSAIAPIKAASKGCGLQHGVSVTAVSGIPLSTPAKVDCMTAIALKSWVDNGIKPAIGRKGGGLKRLDIAASYACRPRNNQRGAKISEHGRGKAVDLAGVTLRDGTSLTVLRDWRKSSKIMRAIHASACGPFGTVLGPKSDAFHRDHFHVDTADYRNGNYCK